MYETCYKATVSYSYEEWRKKRHLNCTAKKKSTENLMKCSRFDKIEIYSKSRTYTIFRFFSFRQVDFLFVADYANCHEIVILAAFCVNISFLFYFQESKTVMWESLAALLVIYTNLSTAWWMHFVFILHLVLHALKMAGLPIPLHLTNGYIHKKMGQQV